MHDHKGRPLKAGDKVLVPFVVKDTYETPDFCNVTLTSVYGRKPDDGKEAFVGNTAVVFRNNVGDENTDLLSASIYQK